MHNPTLRVMEILKLIGLKRDLTLTDISNELNFSKSTIQPILKTLVDSGYIIQDMDKRTYRISTETFKISQSYLNDNRSFELVKKHMKEIVNQCNEICQMGVQDRRNIRNVIYIAKEEPTQSVALISNIGTTLPAHATALGKCILSSYSNEYIYELYKNDMEKLTDNTTTNVNVLIKQLEGIRKDNYYNEKGEATEGIECIAVPLIQDNNVIAALSVSLPTYRSSEEKIELIKTILMKHKIDIDRILVDSPLLL